MTNKTIAYIGIGSYILAVAASTTNDSGVSTASIGLLLVSAISSLVFFYFVTKSLWNIHRIAPLLLIASTVMINVLPIFNTAPIFVNIFRIVYFVDFLWIISLLMALDKESRMRK